MVRASLRTKWTVVLLGLGAVPITLLATTSLRVMKRCLVGLSASAIVLASICIAPGCGGGGGKRQTNDAAIATGGSVPQATGGRRGTGGATAMGGQVGSGGSVMTGGTAASGGIVGTGGSAASGGISATGGTVTRGGATGTGGAVGTGGATATIGTTASGGTIATGGTQAGGSKATGGTLASGGEKGTGGVHGDGGSLGTGGTKADAASTQGCQCTLDVNWSVTFDCYCAASPGQCEINYASYLPDAGASGRSYTGISEYAGCNLAVVYDMDPREDGSRYFDLRTGRLVGLSKTANGGIACPFGTDGGTSVFGLGTGETTVPAGCARTACFASSRAPSYCTY